MRLNAEIKDYKLNFKLESMKEFLREYISNI